MGKYGKVNRPRRESSGNGVVLVVVNTIGSYWDNSIVFETIISSIEHFGIPYRLIDLANERLKENLLLNCSGIIIAQNRIGNFLTKKENMLIADAVKNGIGLVNFDNDIRLYKDSYLEIFGFDRINHHPYASNLMRIINNEHYISEMQNESEYHNFNRMVSGISVETWRDDVVPLAECILGKEQLVYIRHLTPWSAYEPGNYPVVFATKWGKGKAVQFTINPRIWKREFYGHAQGINDLLWRSIIWSVKKPFAANIIPPFVTLSFDDCSGRHDLKYIDISVEHGYKPLVGLFLDNVPKKLYPKIKEDITSGKVEYCTHAFGYYNLLYQKYGDRQFSNQELEKNFTFEDCWWTNIGAEPTNTIRPHFGEMAVNSLPFLKKRNRLFINPPLQTGLLKADMCMEDGYWPYSLNNCFYDYLPDDNDFYVYNAMLERFQEDFLSGCTVSCCESKNNDIEKAGKNMASQIRHGLRGGFYSEIITHEQKLHGLSLDEWSNILSGANILTKGIEKKYASHDDIGLYLKSKDSVWIDDYNVDKISYNVILKGSTDKTLLLSIFYDEEDYIKREYVSINPFKGKAII